MTLRARLLTAMAVVAVVLAVTTLVITRSAESYLMGQVDDQLEAAHSAVGSLIGPNPPGEEETGTLSDLFVSFVVPGQDQLVAGYRPSLAADVTLPEITVSQARLAAARGEAFTAGGTEGGPDYRVMAQRAETVAGADVIVLGLPLDDVRRTLDRLLLVEVGAAALVLAALAVVTWWVLRLGVRPIKQMTEVATAIGDGDLSQRIPAQTPGTEAGALSAALNKMLGEIEHAFEERRASEARLRRFAADASHELRTPITTIRGYAELHRSGGLADESQRDDAMARIESESARMGGLVDDLLHLARLDQGQPLRRDAVALDRVVEDALADARAVEPARPLDATVESVEVVGDEDRLRQVAANLLSNALTHTPPGTHVRVRLAREGDAVVLVVADDGPGMSPGAASRAFERFYRADAGRSRRQGGSGLGLAIVDATVGAHGGTVSLDSGPDRGTTVTVRLPVGGPPTDP